MKNFKKEFFLIVFVFLMSFSITALAATTANVTATVTVQDISVSVLDGSITYGNLAVNTSRSTIASEANDMQTATNNGNIAEDFNIKGTDSANWTLAATTGSDQYVHKFCNETTNDCATPPTSYTALTTSYQTLSSNVSAAGTIDFHLQITTPNPSTIFTQQSVDITVQAVSH
jgi:hypothetical protein